MIRILFVMMVLGGGWSSTVAAQIVASERGTVAQVVDGTRLTVDYSRPRVRGRTNIYGGMEKWGRAWTPGADDATTLEFNRPITLLGKVIPPGKYSVWLVLREKEPWTFVLDPRETLFHTAHPDSTAAQYRLPVISRAVEHTEVLTWDVPVVTTTGMTLRMRWGGMGIDVPIIVTPMYPVGITAERSAPYVGEYDFAWSGDPSERFTVEAKASQLFGRWAPTENGGVQEVQLVPHGADQFMYGVVRNGELWAVNPTLIIRFYGSDGQVRSLEFRNGDRVLAKGTRRDG